MTCESPLFLLGAQRSGTTALGHALADAFHSAQRTFTVNGKLLYLLHRWLTEDDVRYRHLRADEILHALDRKPPGGPATERWRQRVEAGLRRAAGRTAAGAYDNVDELTRELVHAAYCGPGAPGRETWGDKYNEYLTMLPWIRRLFPEARFLVLVRHPAAVASSMLRWTGDRPWNPVTRDAALAKWRAWNEGWLTAAQSLRPGTYLVVEYEAVCRGQRTAVLEDFVGLPLRAALSTMRASTREPGPAAELPGAVLRTWAALRAQEGVR